MSEMIKIIVIYIHMQKNIYILNVQNFSYIVVPIQYFHFSEICQHCTSNPPVGFLLPTLYQKLVYKQLDSSLWIQAEVQTNFNWAKLGLFTEAADC